MKTTIQDCMDDKTRGILSLFVAEIQEVLFTEKLSSKVKIIEIKKILQSWIKPNKLTPEKVKTIPKEITKQYMKGKIGFDELLKEVMKNDKSSK